MDKIIHSYKDIISLANLCEAWSEFVSGKKSKKDVAEFSLNFSQNISKLHEDLQLKTYRHGAYEAFSISDPKPRSIHKAMVRDRLLHHAIYRVLYPYFDRKFIYDSYSCRYEKGTHRAMERFLCFSRKVSKNNTKTCWVLKCDIKKFFASVDQNILLEIVQKHIADQDIVWLLGKVMESFQSTGEGKGLPLGNLTSQLLVNVYMNEFDQYIKHVLKIKYYIRFADDFVILHNDKEYLEFILKEIASFLNKKLSLSLHPEKVSITTFSSGIDFLGWVHFPHHRIPRTSTKRRMMGRLNNKPKLATVASYKGMLSHGNTHKLRQKVFTKKFDNLP